jgi:hypothetical protein
MQADLEGRRTTQLWQQTDTGTRTLGADESSQGVPALFPDSPTSFEMNIGGALDLWCAQSIGTAMPSHREWPRPASEGKLEL